VRLAYIANPNSIHTQRWVAYFAEQGHEVHLISEQKPVQPLPSGIISHALSVPARVSRVRVPGLRLWMLGREARRLLRQIRPDVVHAHTVSPSGWFGALAGIHPLLVTAWGSDLLLTPRRSWIYSLLARWVLRQADYVTCVSQDLAQVARSLGADPVRLEVAPWGVDTEIFRPGPADPTLREQLGLGPGPVVLSLRVVRPLYHPLDIAQAIPQIVEQVPEVQFVIRTHACDPELLAQFQAIVHRHGVAASVHYAGSQPNDSAIADLSRLADVAVSVPASDGAPLSVLEALACGAALVVSDLPSLREWVQDGQQALLVPVGDVVAISSAIVRLLTDEPLRQKLSGNGSRLVRERADSRVWMHHHTEIYRRLIGQWPPRTAAL
jgi:glycosyltransferase involved in cell wall biosynthesis